MQFKNIFTKENNCQTIILPKSTLLWLICIVIILLNNSCATKKYLKPGESFVKQNNIVVKEVKGKEKKRLQNNLPGLVKQNPNKKLAFFFQFARWAYYRSHRVPKKEKKGKRRFNRWVKRKVAQTPAVFDSLLMQESTESMVYYLQNQGYNDARVEAEVKTKRKNSIVTYTAYPGYLYTVDTVIYQSKDKQLERILRDISSESDIEPGDPIREGLFNAEATRITRRLQNMGYAFFSTNYIQPLGDTTNNKTTVYYEVLTPIDQPTHTAYKIGKVTINPIFYQEEQLAPHLDSVINGFHFRILEKARKNMVDPQTILRSVHLNPGDLFMIDEAERTLQQLQNMDYYRNISIRRQIDSLDPNVLNFNINLSPAKRMQFEARVELNNSNFAPGIIIGPLVGFTGLLGYKHRNFFRNATQFTTELSGGFELDLGRRNNIVYSSEFQSTSNLSIPKFIDLNGFFTLLHRTKAIKDDFHQRVKASAKTQIGLNYVFGDIFNFFTRHSFDARFGYQFPIKEGTRLQVNTVGVNYLLTFEKPAFDTLLTNNPLLQNSFEDQLLTGFLFRDFSYERRSKVDSRGGSWFFRGDFEQSGAEILLFNQLSNSINNRDQEFALGNIKFAHYIRTDIDIRRFQSLRSNQSLAFRFNAGIALPYGQYSNEVPYTRQLTVGGPYSMRGWQIRELGPGTYQDPTGADSIAFFQAADIKIELNAEYRFDIFPPFYMKGALFLDVGNIWTLSEEEELERPGSRFTRDFYRQFAVSTGFGLRFDFNYFILRFDGGIRVRDPSQLGTEGNGDPWVFDEWLEQPIRRLNANIAVGLPF